MGLSLTTLSQTGESSLDTNALTELPTDADLHNRTPADSPDAWHETTDQKGTHLQGRAAAPDPAAYGLSPPLFQPLTAYAARGRIFPAPARGNPAPLRAISVQLAPATSGLSRSLADTPTRRSGHVEGQSRTDCQTDSTATGIGN